MYSVNVRDHFMIAHSFEGETFGPAQRLHGATFVVDATFSRPILDSDGMVIDIGRATDVLGRILEDLRYRNLDDDPRFAGRNTTTEFLAHELFSRLVDAARSGGLGESGRQIERIAVTLHESHVAWGRFEGPV